jgi:hypothetical protein
MEPQDKDTPTVNNETNWVEEIGAPAFAAIAEMVAALECDYDRRDALRTERDEWIESAPDDTAPTRGDWSKEFSADSAELAELETAAGDCDDRDSAQDRIMEDPLSVRVFGERVDGEWEVDKVEFLLTTGGPAVRIMAEIDHHGEPCRAWLEVQDWFKPWTQYHGADSEILLAYCQQFGSFCD